MIEPKRTPSPLPPDYLDNDALKVVRRLRAQGYTAYLVGGGVRDLLLLTEPKDFDVVTNARPEEVRATFRNCRLIGRRFRLAHIHFREGKVIEVSTFRRTPQDVDSDDPMIRDDNVFGTEAEDAMRRDFTINALFYDVESQTVIDYVGGVADLKARKICTIGDPIVRFREDPIRILRGIKFAARLGMTMAPAVMEAASEVAPDLLRCAPPRILEEILRMLRSGHAARSFELMQELGVFDVILPDLARIFRQPLPGAPSGPERLMAILNEIDRITREEGTHPPDAVLLAALYLIPLERAEYLAEQEGRSVDPQLLMRRVAGPMLDRLNVPRRFRDRFVRILAVQNRLKRRTRRKRTRPEVLARRDFFPDAFTLFLINARARGEHEAPEVLFWRRYLKDPRHTHTEAPSPRGEHEVKRRRRRRRGRRRGRRGHPRGPRAQSREAHN